MKNAARVASQFIHGSESMTGGNEMFFPVTFREPFDTAALWSAFAQLVRNNRELQRSYHQFQWTYCEKVEDLLAIAEDAFQQPRTEFDLLASYVPTGEGLPIRLLRIDDRRAAFLVHHMFNNGSTMLQWIEKFLALYAGEPDVPVNPQMSRQKPAAFHVLHYLATFLLRAGDSRANTVDLSEGRQPMPSPRYALRAWRFSTTETAVIVAAAKSAGLSVTEALTLWLAESFFAARPQQSRVCVSIPTDLTPWAQPSEPGNHTGSLIVQLFRNRDLPSQVRESFGWARRGVHMWLPEWIGRFATDQSLFEQFRQKSAKPIPQRAPFENFTFAVSSVGVIRGTLANRHLSEVAAFMKTQTVFLCAMTIGGQMNWRVTVAEGLFHPEEAFAIIDRVALRFAPATLPPSSVRPASEAPQT